MPNDRLCTFGTRVSFIGFEAFGPRDSIQGVPCSVGDGGYKLHSPPIQLRIKLGIQLENHITTVVLFVI